MLNMTYKLSALVVCVVFSFFGLASLQKNCCAPKQWTGVIIQRIGRYDRTHDSASLNDAFTRFTYDSINMKTAAITEINKNISTQAMVKERTIRDYKQKMARGAAGENFGCATLIESITDHADEDFSIRNTCPVHQIWFKTFFKKKREWVIVDNNCSVNPLTEALQAPCIPDDAVRLGSYNFSGPSLTTYLILTPGGGQTRKSVTDNSCLPVMETVLTAGPDYFLKMNTYENVTSGISEPTVFHIPNFCPLKNEEIKIQTSGEGDGETLYFETDGRT